MEAMQVPQLLYDEYMIDKVDSWPAPSDLNKYDYCSAPPQGCMLDIAHIVDSLAKIFIKLRSEPWAS